MTDAHPAHSTRRASRDHEGATPSIAGGDDIAVYVVATAAPC